jgi:hypothetical protein
MTANARLRYHRELIQQQKATVGLNKGAAGRGKIGAKSGALVEPPIDAPPTFADAGISKKLSSEAQKLAEAPKVKCEGLVGSGAGN